jgi:hypothetical protein
MTGSADAMNLYEYSVPQFQKMLRSIERWLEEAVAYADKKQFDPNVLLAARLAPDMWSLSRQVGGACDTAKFTVARLCKVPAPPHPDDQATVHEVRARIASVLGYLDGFQPGLFEGLAEHRIAPPPLQGKELLGKDYLFQMQLPNFYFHVTMTYAILRHNGLPLQKLDFLGPLPTL